MTASFDPAYYVDTMARCGCTVTVVRHSDGICWISRPTISGGTKADETDPRVRKRINRMWEAAQQGYTSAERNGVPSGELVAQECIRRGLVVDFERPSPRIPRAREAA